MQQLGEITSVARIGTVGKRSLNVVVPLWYFLEMLKHIGQVTHRVKELREISGVSTDALAKDLDISGETYLGYENGSTHIPLSFLSKIAIRFHVDFAELLTGAAPRLHSFCLVRKGKGVSVERRHQYK